MSYIQVEFGPARVVKKDEPATSKRGFKFNQLAVELYSKKTDWINYTDASEVYATFFAGLMGNCCVKQEDPDFTYEDVCDWVDEVSPEVKKAVMKTFEESNKFKEWLESVKKKLAEQDGESVKKNET